MNNKRLMAKEKDTVKFPFPETQWMDHAEMKKRDQEIRESIIKSFGITFKRPRNRMKRYDDR